MVEDREELLDICEPKETIRDVVKDREYKVLLVICDILVVGELYTLLIVVLAAFNLLSVVEVPFAEVEAVKIVETVESFAETVLVVVTKELLFAAGDSTTGVEVVHLEAL
jgi:hypothetical protein